MTDEFEKWWAEAWPMICALREVENWRARPIARAAYAQAVRDAAEAIEAEGSRGGFDDGLQAALDVVRSLAPTDNGDGDE